MQVQARATPTPIPATAAAGNPRIRDAFVSPMAKGAALALGAGLAAGVSGPLISITTRNTGSFAAASLMQAGAATLAWTSAWAMPGTHVALLPLSKKTAALLAAASVFGSVAAPGTLALALKYTSTASVSLTMNIEPFLAAGAAWPLFHERPSLHMAGAGVFAIASGVLCTVGQLRQAPASGKGIGIAVACAASWAAWDMVLYALCDRNPQHVVGVSSMMGTALCAALAGALGERFPRGAEAGKIYGCGALAFGTVDTLLTLSMRQIGVGRATLLFVMFSLVFGVSIACAMNQGRFTPLIGASLGVALLGGAVLAHERFARQPPAPVAEELAMV